MSESYSDQLALWPCGTWCYYNEIEEFLTFKSDDYEMVGAEELYDRTGDTA